MPDVCFSSKSPENLICDQDIRDSLKNREILRQNVSFVRS